MKLPFWRTKSATPARIPSWATAFGSAEAPRSYDAQVRASYLGNPIAARAIRLVSEGAGGAPLVSNPPGHPALALLASAGTGASGPGLLKTLAAQLLLHGRRCWASIGFFTWRCGPERWPRLPQRRSPETVTLCLRQPVVFGPVVPPKSRPSMDLVGPTPFQFEAPWRGSSTKGVSPSSTTFG